jgi:hypothetical protein
VVEGLLGWLLVEGLLLVDWLWLGRAILCRLVDGLLVVVVDGLLVVEGLRRLLVEGLLVVDWLWLGHTGRAIL